VEVASVPGVVKEFKEFISRGSVVELAVAVVIGAAFTAIVQSIVRGLITPLVGMVGGTDYRDMSFEINGSTFQYGLVINALIYFVIVALVVFFFVVKPINVLNERRRRGEEPTGPDELSDEAALLVEIRDLLASQSGDRAAYPPGPTAAPPPAHPAPSAEPPSTRGW
jgi:large conductance mechanosensitive channel